jgi:serine/threonine protein phosphatase PrpC
MSERRLLSAFSATDADICARSSPAAIMGTTATVAVIVPDPPAACCRVGYHQADTNLGSLYIAHVGDSRAMMVTRACARFVTRDHVPTRQDEADRIHRAGGSVLRGRVDGVLAVSRALGDVTLKSTVISTPEVVHLRISDDDCCLVLATDGLWDYVNERDVYEMLSDESVTLPMAQLAKRLADMAVDRGATDDISVVLVDLAANTRLD